ncbi:MAG: ribosomal-protein-alanine N-acetyltransferase [Ruminococcaceae bacterium]|nr:ribosomal-protein-alanine N-acetyltransferase [Oscillospiraceae bacterium]
MTVEKLGLSDIADVYTIEKECFSHPWSKKSLNEMINDPLSCFFGIREGERIVAYLGFGRVLDEVNIYNIAVLGEYRRRGMANALLSYADGYCMENGISKLMLEVRESNIPAQSLYRKMGCVFEGRRKGYYKDPKEDALLMTKYYSCKEE